MLCNINDFILYDIFYLLVVILFKWEEEFGKFKFIDVIVNCVLFDKLLLESMKVSNFMKI